MQVTISQKVNSYNAFNGQQAKTGANALVSTLNEQDKLELQTKKLNGAVGRCFVGVLLIDVLYFFAKFCSKKA